MYVLLTPIAMGIVVKFVSRSIFISLMSNGRVISKIKIVFSKKLTTSISIGNLLNAKGILPTYAHVTAIKKIFIRFKSLNLLFLLRMGRTYAREMSPIGQRSIMMSIGVKMIDTKQPTNARAAYMAM